MQINRYALRELRERSGLSVTGLADLAGIHQTHLSNIENGKRPCSAATTVALAKALKVPLVAVITNPDALEVLS